MSTGQGNTPNIPQVSTDDLAGLTPEAIEAIVSSRLPSITGGAGYVDRDRHFQAGEGQQAPDPDAAVVEGAGTPPPSSQEGQEGEDIDLGGLGSPDAPDLSPPGSEGEDDRNLDDQGDDDQFVTIGDQRIPTSVVEAYVNFDNLFQSDPRLQALVRSYMLNGNIPPELIAATPAGGDQPGQQPQGGGGSAGSRSPAPPEPPVDLDLDDPATRTLWEANVQTQNQLAAITAHLQRQQQIEQSQQMGRSQAIVNRAVESFKTQHGLSTEDMQKITGVAQRMNLVQSFMQATDPVNGVPQRPDPMAAVEKALEVAYTYLPEYRGKALEATATQRRGEHQRKRKLSSLSRSGGSVPRTTPAPTDAAGRREAMIREVAAMQNGTWDGGSNG